MVVFGSFLKAGIYDALPYRSIMEPIRSELLAIWSILLIALLVAVLLLVRPVRQCFDCVPLVSCILCAIHALLCTIPETLFCLLFSNVLCDLYGSARRMLQCLPLEWYPMAVLTVIPICCDIPRDGAVVFLIVYCMAGMLVCSVEPRRGRKKKMEVAVKTESEFFMGMRIKIDFD